MKLVNFKITMDMYDRFIDNSILNTQDLLNLGFNKNDLTRLVADGKLVRSKKGQYMLANAEGLFNYAKILFSKRYRNLDRANLCLKRCLEIEPDNGSIHTRMFLDSIVREDWEQVFKSFDVIDKVDNEFYASDRNLWLYLLSFITEIPEKYRKRVSEIGFSDIEILEDDLRYQSRVFYNSIRQDIMRHRFRDALIVSEKYTREEERKINVIITEKLLKAVVKANVSDHDYLFGLISDGNYEEVLTLLEGAKQLHGINQADEQFLIVIRDLITMMKEGKLPNIDHSIMSSSFNDALLARDYDKVIEIYNCSRNRKNSKSSIAMGVLLDKFKEEKEKNYDSVVEVVNVDDGKKSSEVDRVSGQLFTAITTCLMNQDIDGAYEYVDKYFSHVKKEQYKEYINDLIKLCVLNGGDDFSEVMYVLSDISHDEFEFNIAAYIQDFYYYLPRKDFYRAAIYLDILSMSEKLGGVKFNIGEMKYRLLDDADRAGITEEALGLKKPVAVTNEEKVALLPSDKVLTVADVMCTVGSSEVSDISEDLEDKKVVVEDDKEETIVPQEEQDAFIEEPSQVTYTLVDVVDKLLDDTNLIMLEPMSEEDIQRVVKTTQSFPEIQTIVLEEETGEKRVVLRYFSKRGDWIDISSTLAEANRKFKNWEYNDAIGLFQLVLPKLDTPKSFIYSKLGFCYMKTTYDGDYSKAIDYFTMAAAQSLKEENPAPIDHIKIINDLKRKCNYNGLSISGDRQTNINGTQYKKES